MQRLNRGLVGKLELLSYLLRRSPQPLPPIPCRQLQSLPFVGRLAAPTPRPNLPAVPIPPFKVQRPLGHLSVTTLLPARHALEALHPTRCTLHAPTDIPYAGDGLWADNDRTNPADHSPPRVTGGGQLTLKGERRPPQPEHGVWHCQERGFGAFSRTLTLPAPVNSDKVEARFLHGVLTVKLLKAEAARSRKITVKFHEEKKDGHAYAGEDT